MKRISFFFLGVLLSVSTLAQSPQGIQYQAVARDGVGNTLKDVQLTVRMAILQGGTQGTVVWEEEHQVTTNAFGLFSLIIGDPQATKVDGILSAFGDIDWSLGDYFLRVSLDDGNGFRAYDPVPFLSVPYAQYATTVADKNDADADPENEIQDLQLTGNILTITRNDMATEIDLSAYLDNTDDQQLSLTDHTLSISGGNQVVLPDQVNDADHDPANEIQDLQLTGNVLSITNNNSATPIDMSRFLDNPGWIKNGKDTLSFTGSVAVGSEQANGTKLAVRGDDVTSDKPLFEVKRKDGQTVFAVYNDSIRMNVNLGAGKGPRGGFAIGGFGMTKGTVQDLFRLTPDSVRFYIDQSSKGPHRSGFAIGGFGMTKNTSGNFLDITPENYFIGQESGRKTVGLYNSFLGYQAGEENVGGTKNIFLGYQSGLNNVEGSYNVFIGNEAGFSNIGGSYAGENNIFIGYQSGYSNQYGTDNVFIGNQAGYSNKREVSTNAYQSSFNVFVGRFAGADNTIGQSNTFIGDKAGADNTTGRYNVFLGKLTGGHNLTGNFNAFLGSQAGETFKEGDNNVIIGNSAGNLYQGGATNVFLGAKAGSYLKKGDGNIFIGYLSGPGYSVDSVSNQLYIGTPAHYSPVIWGDLLNGRVVINGTEANNTNNRTFFVAGAAGGTTPWYNDSDERLKTDIHTISGALEKVEALRGVTFRWKDPQSHEPGEKMGFIAQEAGRVVPQVVDDRGKYYSMQYAPITALLVEAVKEQQQIIEAQDQKIKELEALQDEVEALKTQLQSLMATMNR